MASTIGRRNTSCISRSALFFILAIYWAGNLISSCSARDCHTSFRRAWRDLSCQEQDEFLDAIKTVKDSGAYDEFIDVHLSVERMTHGPAEFLPWHRYVLILNGTELRISERVPYQDRYSLASCLLLSSFLL